MQATVSYLEHEPQVAVAHVTGDVEVEGRPGAWNVVVATDGGAFYIPKRDLLKIEPHEAE